MDDFNNTRRKSQNFMNSEMRDKCVTKFIRHANLHFYLKTTGPKA